MAYFRCSVGSGGSGIPLVVTCASAFAGLTITCTDGTTTLTDTCPSSSPYEITFNLPNTGTWTVSGTISGTTYTESVLVEEFDCELQNNINVSVDFYSAANDTVSYTGAIDGQTHTITTDTDGHASATITIPVTGTATITFTSSVAKNPSSLSSDYSKSITITSETTSIYLMPDNVLYWWGYKANNNIINTISSVLTPTYNTNSITAQMRSSDNSWINAIVFNKPSGSFTSQNIIGLPNRNSTNTTGSKVYGLPDNNNGIICTANTIFMATRTNLSSSTLVMYKMTNPLTSLDIYAFWYE